MSKQDKETKVWIGVEDLTSDPEFLKAQEQEFVELPIVDDVAEQAESENGHSRRDFLKYAGFGLGAATLAGCEAPIKKAIPYVVKPEEIVPGVATYYASTFAKGGDCLPVLVKTREGRPIKIEGNPNSSMINRKTVNGLMSAGTSARAQASVLDLYDTFRLKGPASVSEGKTTDITWNELDTAVKSKLAAASNIYVVSHSVVSPTLEKTVAALKAKYPQTKHVQYDPFSSSAMIEANEQMYQQPWIPNYKFGNAKCIVGIEADFLGTWISPVEFSRDYAKNRRVNDEDINKATKAMSFHVQFESRMSMTGSNADHRALIKPSEMGQAVKMLHDCVMAELGSGSASDGQFAWAKSSDIIKATAKHLVANKGKALVVCGVNNLDMQRVVNKINEKLGAYNPGGTIDKDSYSNQRRGRDKAIADLASNLGSNDAVIVYDANPAFDIPELAADFAAKLQSASLSVSLSGTLDDTAALCQYVAPDHHYLEAWGDANPKQGHYFLTQPTIAPLFNTRTAGLSFLVWAGVESAGNEAKNDQRYLTYIKNNWKQTAFGAQSKYASFQTFWDNTLRTGVFETAAKVARTATPETTIIDDGTESNNADTTAISTPQPPVLSGSDVTSSLSALSSSAESGALEVTLYETISLGAGQYANNPWLQEMPDPVMRTTWDNFISVPIKWDGDINYNTLADLKDGDYAVLSIGGAEKKLPAIRQFGQLEGTVAVGVGYGRKQAGKAGSNIGVDMFPQVKRDANGNFSYYTTATEPSQDGRDPLFACVQMHHTYGLKNKNESGETINVDEQILGHRGFQGSLTNRSVFFQATADELPTAVERLAKKREDYQYLNSKGLYPGHDDVYALGHHWAMAIDMNACTGCNACSVACMAENNVPVVGKFEVNKVHEMTWLRIDRYYYGEEDAPNTAYMPMMCQHCDNAPCENVCPVAATNHSSEGLNQMAYNRCIGTRYCANNCPYKVRRFNWLDYTSADLFPSNEVDMNRDIEGAEYYTYMTDNLTRMVLNPDVTVRSRGVIEKCSFCVQRIQEGKLKAKVEGRRLEDGDVITACMQACPTDAIVFGDRNDKTSEVYKLMNTKRSYLPLEEVNVKSSVTYLMKVTNRDSSLSNVDINDLKNNFKAAASPDHGEHHS